MKYLVLDQFGNEIVNCIDDICRICVDQCKKENNSIVSSDKCDDRRYGIKENKGYKFFLCSSKSNTKTTKLFKEKIEMLVYSIPAIVKVKEKAIADASHFEREKYSKIVHNLKTLNAQSIQAQYKFIPQNQFTDNYSNLFNFINNQISLRPKEATIALLRLSKNNSHMKTEFSTHEKLSVENPNLLLQLHDIRSVILNVYHSFDIDFRENNIGFKIGDAIRYIKFDYDTIRVALYHIFSNSIKYSSPHSKIQVNIYDKNEDIFVDFEMKSLHIDKEEKERIYEDSYSGRCTKVKHRNSSGLGMGLIRKALIINNADIEVLAGEEIVKSDEQEYSNNIFRLTFKRNCN